MHARILAGSGASRSDGKRQAGDILHGGRIRGGRLDRRAIPDLRRPRRGNEPGLRGQRPDEWSWPQVVALKTLRGELLRSRVRVSRFATECRLWVQLGEHPNIVRAHSVEVFDGRPYVVLELIQGGDLNRWIGTPRSGSRAKRLRFGYQFCLGMEHALRQGLHCHRDIKPANLMVTENGTLKITDFGLARISEEMIAVRQELPDGSIPLSEPAECQPIIWTDPRDTERSLIDRRPSAAMTSADVRMTGSLAAGVDGRHATAGTARRQASNTEHGRQRDERVHLAVRDL